MADGGGAGSADAQELAKNFQGCRDCLSKAMSLEP